MIGQTNTQARLITGWSTHSAITSAYLWFPFLLGKLSICCEHIDGVGNEKQAISFALVYFYGHEAIKIILFFNFIFCLLLYFYFCHYFPHFFHLHASKRYIALCTPSPSAHVVLHCTKPLNEYEYEVLRMIGQKYFLNFLADLTWKAEQFKFSARSPSHGRPSLQQHPGRAPALQLSLIPPHYCNPPPTMVIIHKNKVWQKT